MKFGLAILLLSLLGLGGYFWLKDRARLKKKTSETMSDAVWESVEAERREALEKRRLFREAMEKASRAKT